MSKSGMKPKPLPCTFSCPCLRRSVNGGCRFSAKSSVRGVSLGSRLSLEVTPPISACHEDSGAIGHLSLAPVGQYLNATTEETKLQPDCMDGRISSGLTLL